MSTPNQAEIRAEIHRQQEILRKNIDRVAQPSRPRRAFDWAMRHPMTVSGALLGVLIASGSFGGGHTWDLVRFALGSVITAVVVFGSIPVTRRSKVTLLAVGVAFTVAVVGALLIADTASADRQCVHGVLEGVDITMNVSGTTSCALGKAVARQAIARDYPRIIRAKSPVTHKWYTLRRLWIDDEDYDYFSVYYRGHGKGSTSINVQITART